MQYYIFTWFYLVLLLAGNSRTKGTISGSHAYYRQYYLARVLQSYAYY